MKESPERDTRSLDELLRENEMSAGGSTKLTLLFAPSLQAKWTR